MRMGRLSARWRKEGCSFEEQVLVQRPIFYRHVYRDDSSLAGVIVDYERADDFHYELERDGWDEFCERYLMGTDSAAAFKEFLVAHPALFAFEDALEDAGIEFTKIAFY
jgi:hypothetical protein